MGPGEWAGAAHTTVQPTPLCQITHALTATAIADEPASACVLLTRSRAGLPAKPVGPVARIMEQMTKPMRMGRMMLEYIPKEG